MEYKIGDKVKINNLPTSKFGKSMWYAKEMNKWIGQIVTINNIGINNISCDETIWYFPFCSLEPYIKISLPDELFTM